jgi:hypothetical protein
MPYKAKRFLLVTIAGLMSVFLSGCSKDIDSVDKLLEQLKKQGIVYTSTERISLRGFKHARVEEAVSLQGEELDVEIYRIEDRRTYKAFGGMVLLLAAAEHKTGEPLPERPQLYSKRPFVIVVRREPETGCVKEALVNVFGGVE